MDSEESRFFDALDHISQDPDFVSEDNFPCGENWEYDLWISSPQSVVERRRKFIRWMESNSNEESSMNSNNKNGVFTENFNRIMENGGAVLRTTSIEDEFSSSRSSMSSWSSDDVDLSLSECRNESGNSNCGNVCNFEGSLGKIRMSCRELENVSQLSPSGNVYTPRTLEKLRLKDRCLSKLGSMTCMVSDNVKDDNLGSNNSSPFHGIRRVKVRHIRKRLKEFSALFAGQDIQAHEGAILAMKFSLDGEYLASGGEDKIVRVWRVIEDQRSEIIDVDPSCVYFSMNHMSELGPHMVEKDKINKSKSLKKTQDSACVVFPPKVLRILEKPLHAFEGHKGEISDLSWSKDNCLLSASVDKTVRLWKVGVDHCLKVFSHSDYVTCTQFNPVNDDYFISGSIDGKVRIWTISGYLKNGRASTHN